MCVRHKTCQKISKIVFLCLFVNISLFLFSLCQGWYAAHNFFTASSDSLFHPPLSLVFFFLSSSSPAFFTQSSHITLGLARLLPSSRNYAALFGSLSSAILSTCPAHCSLLPVSLSVKLLCTPVSSLNSTILLLSALITLALFRTQLFSHTCSLCWCRSVIANVSVPFLNWQRLTATKSRTFTISRKAYTVING